MPTFNSSLAGSVPDNSDTASGLVEVEFHIGPDNLSRLLDFDVPENCVIRVRGFTSGGGGGGGGSATGDTGGGGISGGGGATAGASIDDIDIPFVKGENVAIYLGRGGYGGAPGADGENGDLGYIKRGGHSGVTIVSLPGGLKGLAGTSSTSGKGADAPGGTYGAAATGGAARTTTNNGIAGGNVTQPTRFILPDDPYKPLHCAGAGSGGYATIGGGGVNGGTSGFASQNMGNVGGGTGNASAPQMAGGGGGACSMSKAWKSQSGGTGGGFLSSNNYGTGWSNSVPGGGGGGGANGCWGGDGGHGALRLLVPNKKSFLDSLPPRTIFYEGAGLAIQQDAVSLHIGGLPYGRASKILGVVSGGNSGKLQNVTGRTFHDPSTGQLDVIRFPTAAGGTIPAPLALDTDYYVVGLGTTNLFASVSATPGGTPITITSVGVTGTLRTAEHSNPNTSGQALNNVFDGNAYVNEPAEDPGLLVGNVRLWQTPDMMWVQLCPTGTLGSGVPVFDATTLQKFDDVMAYHVARGRNVTWCIGSAPNWAIASGNGLVDAWGYYQGADHPDLVSVAALITAMVTRYNVTLYPTQKPLRYIQPMNEPNFGSPAVQRFYQGTAAQGAAYFKAVFQAAKAVDATVKIVGPSFSNGALVDCYPTFNYNGPMQFLTASDGAGGFGKDWIDGFGGHWYNVYEGIVNRTDVAQLSCQMARVDRNIRKALKQAGMSNWATFPIYNDEWGVNLRASTYPWTTAGEIFQRMQLQTLGCRWAQNSLYSYGLDFSEYLSTTPANQKLIGELHTAVAGKTAVKIYELWDGRMYFEDSTGGIFVSV